MFRHVTEKTVLHSVRMLHSKKKKENVSASLLLHTSSACAETSYHCLGAFQLSLVFQGNEGLLKVVLECIKHNVGAQNFFSQWGLQQLDI